MLLSKLVGERVKEAPADVTILSHALLARAGYIKPVANGIFSLTSPAQLMAKNIEDIIRDEMNKIDGQSSPSLCPGNSGSSREDIQASAARWCGLRTEAAKICFSE